MVSAGITFLPLEKRMSVRRSLMPIALLVSVSLAIWSCSDSTPAGVESTTLAARQVGGSRLLLCLPRAYDSVTQVIGPEGGVLVAGGHVLVVDSLALDSPVSITMVAPSQFLNVVRLQPEGLRFKNGVHGIGALLATNVDNCGVHANQVLQVVNVSESLGIVSYLQAPSATESVVVTKYKTYLGSLWVGGLLRHFSNYAVAW
jgi:hypothetical protein